MQGYYKSMCGVGIKWCFFELMRTSFHSSKIREEYKALQEQYKKMESSLSAKASKIHNQKKQEEKRARQLEERVKELENQLADEVKKGEASEQDKKGLKEEGN